MKDLLKEFYEEFNITGDTLLVDIEDDGSEGCGIYAREIEQFIKQKIRDVVESVPCEEHHNLERSAKYNTHAGAGFDIKNKEIKKWKDKILLKLN